MEERKAKPFWLKSDTSLRNLYYFVAMPARLSPSKGRGLLLLFFLAETASALVRDDDAWPLKSDPILQEVEPSPKHVQRPAESVDWAAYKRFEV